MAPPIPRFARHPEGLEGRDPDFIRRMLPRLWLATSVYFRPEVNGFDRVPDEPVLFVGNHSGGANIPDTFVFGLAYNTWFTVDGRPLIGLAHKVVANAPWIGNMARKFGMVAAHRDAADRLLQAGANVLVYPGGDVEALRPWTERNRIRFDGRKGFLKIAHRNRVKIVPVVSTGGHDTFFVLNDGRRTAKRLGIDKFLRIKSVPISLSIPWGIVPGDLPHIPLPAKIRIEVLEPIDLHEMFGDEPDWDEAYDFVTSLMQAALSSLAARTVFPVLG
jgi:1-acyl-sn-glycerol-3-phosphate acyltransferase